MNAMIISLRSMIAATAVAAVSAAVTFSASAATNFNHSALSETTLAKTGFLGFKSFLIGPSGRDEPGVAMEGMRIISPATLFPPARGYRQSHLPPELFMPLKRMPPPATEDMDNLKIDVQGVPMNFSLGLKQALHKDLTDHVDYFGVSGLASPATGFASAAYLQSATHEVLKNIDRLERLTVNPVSFRADTALPQKTLGLREPPTILLFLTGLLFIVLLRGERLQTKATI
jgi:hypothetical protein